LVFTVFLLIFGRVFLKIVCKIVKIKKAENDNKFQIFVSSIFQQILNVQEWNHKVTHVNLLRFESLCSSNDPRP
jgi:hypothetical protein